MTTAASEKVTARMRANDVVGWMRDQEVALIPMALRNTVERAVEDCILAAEIAARAEGARGMQQRVVDLLTEARMEGDWDGDIRVLISRVQYLTVDGGERGQ